MDIALSTALNWTPPDNAALEDSLSIAMGVGTAQGKRVSIVARERNPYESTFPCEIVTVSIGGGEPLRLFCKHQGGRIESREGHRRDVSYEIEVYRTVLAPIGSTAPRYHGGRTDLVNGHSMLVIQHLANAVHATKLETDPPGVIRAAAWIGDFHARSTGILQLGPPLWHYDVEYLNKWPLLVLNQDSAFVGKHEWLRDLMGEYMKNAGQLAGDQCVVHGELYPDNILFSDGVVVPVDWQSAAVGAGEIDLAILTHGCWGRDIIGRCEEAYCEARWPLGAPPEFKLRLALARVYWLSRVLAEQPGWIEGDEYQRELRHAYTSLQEIGR